MKDFDIGEYRYGTKGKVYKTRKQAERQGRAIRASQKGECGMTNFERITQSEATLSDWLYYCVNCDWCPICEECVIDDGPIRDRCFRLICEWLKREA